MEIIHILMAEHRLIERMVALLENEVGTEELKHTANPAFIRAAVDFFKNYADRLHHGKEEGILFRELAKKKIKPEHKGVLEQLLREHNTAREEVKQLNEAAQRYERGDMGALSPISTHLKRLVALYPPHILTEDKEFFPASMEYFAEDERQHLLAECREFDAGMEHEKYVGIVKQYESG
jgi:hemerythrin-like domain-containing protein